MSLLSTTTDQYTILRELRKDAEDGMARLVASAESEHEGKSFAEICEWDSFYARTAAFYRGTIAAANERMRYL